MLEHLYIKNLRQTDLAKGLPEEVIIDLCRGLVPYPVHAGDTIFTKGEIARDTSRYVEVTLEIATSDCEMPQSVEAARRPRTRANNNSNNNMMPPVCSVPWTAKSATAVNG